MGSSNSVCRSIETHELKKMKNNEIQIIPNGQAKESLENVTSAEFSESTVRWSIQYKNS